jgi:hypothetical protein
MTQAAEPKKINRLAISLAVGAGVAVGSAPAAALLERPLAWLTLTLTCWMVALFSLRNFHKTTYHAPNPAEYLLAAFNATFMPAFLGMLWIIIYYALFLVIAGVEWVISNTTPVTWDEANLAYLISVVTAAVLYWISSGSEASSIADDLSPDTAGLRSPYYTLLTRDRDGLRRGLVIRLLTLAALVIIGFVWSMGWLWLLILEIYLFFASLGYIPSQIETEAKTDSPLDVISSIGKVEKQQLTINQSAAQNVYTKIAVPGFMKGSQAPPEDDFPGMIALLFEAAGWEVERKPRTQDPTIDPLLVDVDLLARHEQVAVVAEVIHAPGPPLNDLQRPSALKQAVYVLAEARTLDIDSVSASLILVDTKPDDRLVSICKRLDLRLELLEGDEIRLALRSAEPDDKARREAAQRLLRFN